MPKNLKRYYGKQDLHFLTCTCYRRLPLLGSARSRGVFVKILGEVRDRYGFFLVGYVVMPNHIHLHLSAAGPQRIAPRRQRQLRYMHFNPVNRGLVRDPKDWPWSSYSHYAMGKQGLVRIDDIT